MTPPPQISQDQRDRDRAQLVKIVKRHGIDGSMKLLAEGFRQLAQEHAAQAAPCASMADKLAGLKP